MATKSDSLAAQACSDVEYWAGNPSIEIMHGHISLQSVTEARHSCVVLAFTVPCHMPPGDFCDFVGAFGETTHRDFRHCRVLHGHNPEEYLVALWLTEPDVAASLVKRFSGQQYNAIEAGVCWLSLVTGSTCTVLNGMEECSASPCVVKRADASVTQPGILPELFPTTWRSAVCPVCLEPFEEPRNYCLSELGGGVPLTILCGHTFHARCLSRWCDATCPVCRFQQHPCQTSCCDVCGRSDNLLICLVCGLIGCGTLRDVGGHAQQHFETMQHTYALEVNTQRVWDFAGRGYVHRLLYNSADGKMVEHSLPDGEEEPSAAHDDSANDLSGLARHVEGAKKHESLVSEFNALLASQMTAQRRFYEERQQELQARHLHELEEARQRMQNVVVATEEVRERSSKSSQTTAVLERELAEVTNEEVTMRRQWKALEAMNEKMSAEQRKFEEQVEDTRGNERAARKQRASEIEELQQQIRDLERFLQMRKQCANSMDAAELQGSHLLVTETARDRRKRRPR